MSRRITSPRPLQPIPTPIPVRGEVVAELVVDIDPPKLPRRRHLLDTVAAELSLACDIRLAAAHATFALPEALWGGFPGAGGPVRLPMLVGRARALELMCTGREIDAAEMERLGLVLAVHPSHRLMAEATSLAARIAASGPLATRGAKRIVTTRLYGGFGEARALSDTLRHALEWSHDVDEGMAAHREGRPPRFTGR